MRHLIQGIPLVVLLFSVSAAAQDHQAAQAEQAKPAAKKEAAPPPSLMFGPPPQNAEAVARGRALFIPSCGFCHGNDAAGKSGPDLIRSSVVLHDEKGSTLGPVILGGRVDKGMPAFPSFTPEQIADIAAFLHSRTESTANRFTYEIKGLLTGNAKAGEVFFNGAGKCNTCHSPTGDLAGIAGKFQPADLQRRFLDPEPSWIDMLRGKSTKPPPSPKVTVTFISAETVAGDLVYIDEFNVTFRDANGWTRSVSRQDAKVDIKDPLAAHRDLLPQYTDADMHNMLAYLETLK
jgi:cytochrome c oxidase cbb3-type subunit III